MLRSRRLRWSDPACEASAAAVAAAAHGAQSDGSSSADRHKAGGALALIRSLVRRAAGGLLERRKTAAAGAGARPVPTSNPPRALARGGDAGSAGAGGGGAAPAAPAGKPHGLASTRREELMSGAAFCAASLAMTLLNKAAALSGPAQVPAPASAAAAAAATAAAAAAIPAPQLPVVSLLAFQCLCTLLLTYASCALGLGRAPRLRARHARLWLPVNALFAAMVATSFAALRHMGVPMLTVLKNLTSVLVVAGDRWAFGTTCGAGVWLTLALMALSALCAAASDLEFSAPGYAWQLINNVTAAAYSLGLRLAILKMGDEEEEEEEQEKEEEEEKEEKEEKEGKRGRPDDVGMVIYSNLGALPLLGLLALCSGELARLAQPGALRALASDRRFVAAALSSSATGFLMSVASMRFMRCTTATTFALVASLNKVPLAVLGALLFAPPPGRPPMWSSPWHVASVGAGLGAGAAFAHAKSREDCQRRARRE